MRVGPICVTTWVWAWALRMSYLQHLSNGPVLAMWFHVSNVSLVQRGSALCLVSFRQLQQHRSQPDLGGSSNYQHSMQVYSRQPVHVHSSGWSHRQTVVTYFCIAAASAQVHSTPAKMSCLCMQWCPSMQWNPPRRSKNPMDRWHKGGFFRGGHGSTLTSGEETSNPMV